MPMCCVLGCTSFTGLNNVEKKSFYRIPNPKNERARAARWIHNIGNAIIHINTFVASKDKVVCSDHFHESCFKRDLKFELMPDSGKRKRDLVHGAVPTIFEHKVYDIINIDGTVVASKQPASRKRTLQLEQRETIKKLIVGSTDKPQSTSTSTQSISVRSSNTPVEDEPFVNSTNIDIEVEIDPGESRTKPEYVDAWSQTDVNNVDANTQTDDILQQLTSTPVKSCENSLAKVSIIEDPDDSDFIIDKTESFTQDIDILADRKFVVFESMLDELITLIRCQECNTPVKNVTKTSLGTSLTCILECELGHTIRKWRCQPLIGKLPAFNLLISASIVFSGSTYERMRKPVEFAGLNFVNENTFYNIQRALIVQTINRQYEENIQQARAEAKKHEGVLLGDGRFDSPGKAAKYCTYSFQSPFTSKIIATSTIQTTKGKGSSPLEMKGFENCLQDLEKDNLNIGIIATDRNRQIAKWIRVERPLIVHKFDPWHFAKNIKSKLRTLIKRKGCKIIQEWIKPIGNHLFWCAENSNGDAEQLKQMWQSVLHHIVNKHSFPRKYPKYTKCRHKRFTKEKSRRTKWLTKSSAAYNAIEKVILDSKNLNDMGHLTRPYHTGSLEVYHSLINSYASKRQEFDINVMDARVKLAVLDHNHNVNRAQATVTKERKGSQKKGAKQWKFVSSKLSKEWVAKPKKEAKSVEFVKSLLREVVERKQNGAKIDVKANEVEGRLKSPTNIAYTERPETSKILEKYSLMRRFKR